MPLFLLFIVLPLLELITFIQVGAEIGILKTLFWIFFTAFAGMLIVRVQGVTTLMKIRERLAAGEIPAHELLRGFLLAVAGVLLIVPGFITDAFGVLLLIPWVSGSLAKYLLKNNQLFTQSATAAHREKEINSVFVMASKQKQPDAGNILEGEFERKD